MRTTSAPNKRSNIIAAIYAALFASAYLGISVLEDWLTGELDVTLLLTFASFHILFATMIGAAVSSWCFFPLLGAGSGARGVLRDLGWVVLALLLATALAGTLVFPGIATVGMPVFFVLQTASSPGAAIILTLGVISTLALARRQP